MQLRISERNSIYVCRNDCPPFYKGGSLPIESTTTVYYYFALKEIFFHEEFEVSGKPDRK